MKYVKTFEERLVTDNITLKYKSLDYVFVSLLADSEFDSLSRIKFVNGKEENRTWDYLIEAYNYKMNKMCDSYISEDYILRKLTPEEIEEFQSKIEVIKYNL